MKLVDLSPEFLKIIVPLKNHQEIDSLEEAQGIFFLCPKCFELQPDGVGVHGVICWFSDKGVLEAEVPGPGRWKATGTGYFDLTLTAASSSVRLGSGCMAHFFVESGEIRMC